MEPDPRYPIGKFDIAQPIMPEVRPRLIQDIREAPEELRKAVQGLSEMQLDMPYRQDGWTLRQVVHHVADSHLNSYVRFRLALTEEEPAVKGYDEKKWAELQDARTGSLALSVPLLAHLHGRWVMLMKSMSESDWKRTFRHSELGPVRLEQALGLYSWHGKHHTAHITSLRKRMGW
jgi:hypothetical protein